MPNFSIALNALISRKKYRLKCAPKVTKTDRQMDHETQSVVSEFQVYRRAHNRESPTAELM